MGLSSLHTFTESLALRNAGLSFYENYSPKKNSEIFWHRPSLGYKAPSAGTGPHSTFPVKPSEIPIFRTSPSNGYNPSTEPTKALKSARFSCPLTSDICDLLPTYTLTCSHSAQNTPFFNIFLTAFRLPLGISETNFPILQD